MSPKALQCLFLLDVLCSFRRTEKVFGIMDRCLKCKHYLAFLKEMEEEDEKMMDVIDKIHELTATFHRGEIGEEEYRRRYFELDRESE